MHLCNYGSIVFGEFSVRVQNCARIYAYFGLIYCLREITPMGTARQICMVENVSYLRTSVRSANGIGLHENDIILIYSVTKVTNNQYSKIVKNI